VRIIETTPAVERTYRVELTYQELRHIRMVLGNQSWANHNSLGLSDRLGTELWAGMRDALGENDE
jgi:hypothetical protein